MGEKVVMWWCGIVMTKTQEKEEIKGVYVWIFFCKQKTAYEV